MGARTMGMAGGRVWRAAVALLLTSGMAAMAASRRPAIPPLDAKLETHLRRPTAPQPATGLVPLAVAKPTKARVLVHVTDATPETLSALRSAGLYVDRVLPAHDLVRGYIRTE